MNNNNELPALNDYESFEFIKLAEDIEKESKKFLKKKLLLKFLQLIDKKVLQIKQNLLLMQNFLDNFFQNFLI